MKFENGTSIERGDFLNKMQISAQFTAWKKSTGFETSADPFYVFIENPSSKKYEFVSIRSKYGLFSQNSAGLSEDDNIIPFTPEINTEIDNIITAKALQNPIAAHIGIGKNLTEAKSLTKIEKDKMFMGQGIFTHGVFLDTNWVLEVSPFSGKFKDDIHVDKENYIELIKKDGLLSLKVTNDKEADFFEDKKIFNLYYLTQPYIRINPTPRARLYPSYTFPIGTKVLVVGLNSSYVSFSFTAQTVSDLNAQDLIKNATSSMIYGRPIQYATIYIYDQELGKYLFVGAKKLDHLFILNESINTEIDNMIINRALDVKENLK